MSKNILQHFGAVKHVKSGVPVNNCETASPLRPPAPLRGEPSSLCSRSSSFERVKNEYSNNACESEPKKLLNPFSVNRSDIFAGPPRLGEELRAGTVVDDASVTPGGGSGRPSDRAGASRAFSFGQLADDSNESPVLVLQPLVV